MSQAAHQSGNSSEDEKESIDHYSVDDDIDDESTDQVHFRKNKSIEIASNLMIKIVIEDLKRSPDKSKTYEILKSFDSESKATRYPETEEDCNFMQFLIIIKLLKYLCKNPKVQQEYGDGCILVNLNKILANMEQLVPYNPLIVIKSLKLINSLAFKNSMEVRRQMKFLKMFDLRD